MLVFTLFLGQALALITNDNYWKERETDSFVIQYANGIEKEYKGKLLYFHEYGINNEWKVIRYFDGQHKTILVKPENAGKIVLGVNN